MTRIAAMFHQTMHFINETFHPGPSVELNKLHFASCRAIKASAGLVEAIEHDKIGAYARGARRGSRRKKQ